MKVFISWSGPTSQKMADALKDWLAVVIPAVDPFVSNQDIAVGKEWTRVLAHELEKTKVGIICVTPFNLGSPWLNFESGSLSKAVDQSCIMPLLLGVDCSKLPGTLAQFQSTLFTKEGMLALLLSLNKRLPAGHLSDEHLRRNFELCWPQLQEKLRDVVDRASGETETGFPWCFTAKDLERRELDPGAKSVWVVTPWPYQDVQLTCLVDSLRRNIGLGVKYTFIIPEDPTGQAPKVLHDMFAGKILVHEVETEKFESLAVTHYVVLNPDYEDACRPRVFLEIPTEERGFWIETSAEAAIKFTNRFRLMLPPEHLPGTPLGTGDEPAAGPLPS
jgi:hypothetical protein